jgi:hypothetical protein
VGVQLLARVATDKMSESEVSASRDRLLENTEVATEPKNTSATTNDHGDVKDFFRLLIRVNDPRWRPPPRAVGRVEGSAVT